ncbi:MAG: multiheme c-type cytochrome [Myxococcales bacterium]|nr:cytochrome c family protein [Myxococcota bacterium]MDW8280287.1 multiheme c-type cytochrome [Myxococcales bacterium]
MVVGLVVLAACDEPEMMTRQELLRPEACRTCHPDHYREWSGSMHAYAADDPVFVAMNARGQRETGGALGDFCVRCHAPMALREGRTRDGLNLSELPSYLRGVTCLFCHEVDAVQGTHNNPLRLAGDGVLRGAIADPTGRMPHRAAYSPLHDRRRPESAALCGSCHDVVTPAGVHLERTFSEWQASLFGDPRQGRMLTCGTCHMTGRTGLAAQVEGVRLRRVHDHSMPGVDVALTPWPEREAQWQGVLRELETTLAAQLCVLPDLDGARLEVTLDNVAAGHMFPSGAAQDRRAFVEIVAWAGGQVIYESGRVGDQEDVLARNDPDLWLLRDRMLDAQGQEVHDFWAARSYVSELLPPAVTSDPRDPRFFHAVKRTYRVPRMRPDRVTMRVRIRPIGLDVLGKLVAAGDLDPAVVAAMPTFTLGGTVLEWNGAGGFGCVPKQ